MSIKFQLIEGYNRDDLICTIINDYKDVNFYYGHNDEDHHKELVDSILENDSKFTDHIWDEFPSTFSKFLNDNRSRDFTRVSDIHILTVDSWCNSGAKVACYFFLEDAIKLNNDIICIADSILGGNVTLNLYTMNLNRDLIEEEICSRFKDVKVHDNGDVVISGKDVVKIYTIDTYDNIVSSETIDKRGIK